MIDIMCTKCGEPWEIDTLHDVAAELGSTFDEVRRRFSAEGCVAFGASHGAMGDPDVLAAASELAELLGDDVDGLAALYDDFGLL